MGRTGDRDNESCDELRWETVGPGHWRSSRELPTLKGQESQHSRPQNLTLGSWELWHLLLWAWGPRIQDLFMRCNPTRHCLLLLSTATHCPWKPRITIVITGQDAVVKTQSSMPPTWAPRATSLCLLKPELGPELSEVEVVSLCVCQSSSKALEHWSSFSSPTHGSYLGRTKTSQPADW
jgi:hypothetical protein